MRRLLIVVFVIAALGALPAGTAEADPPGPSGEVHTLRTWDPGAGELPEGIAVDKRGRVYVSMTFRGELRRIDPDGSEQIVATLPTGNGFGPLGLAVDAAGNVYVAVVTFEPATHGVYVVAPDGASTRLPGSEQLGFVNGLAFGDGGDLYASDSMNGAVWRIPKGGTAQVWVQDALLAGDGSGPLPFPVGANGLAHRNGTVYVTNTEIGSVVAVPVLPDGSAGEPSLLAQSPALVGADGVAVDVRGHLYVAVIAQSTLLRVSPDGEDIVTLADGDDGLDFTSSVAFGTGRSARKTLFMVNFGVAEFFGAEPGDGPALLALDVGFPGVPQP